MNHKKMILVSLLGILCICLVYAYVETPRLKKAPPRSVKNVAGSKRPVMTQGDRAQNQRINLDFIKSEPIQFPGAKRDIFRMAESVAIAIEVNDGPEPVATPALNTAVIEAPPPVSTPPVDVVQKSLNQFTYVGFLDKGGEKTVFLTSDGQVFLVKQGDRFGVENEFRVVELDNQLLKVKLDEREDIIEVPLVDKKKLSLSVSAPVSVPRPYVAPLPQTSNKVVRPQRIGVGSSGKQDELRENSESFQELLEKFKPGSGRIPGAPARGAVLEGDINGTNQ